MSCFCYLRFQAVCAMVNDRFAGALPFSRQEGKLCFLAAVSTTLHAPCKFRIHAGHIFLLHRLVKQETDFRYGLFPVSLCLLSPEKSTQTDEESACPEKNKYCKKLPLKEYWPYRLLALVVLALFYSTFLSVGASKWQEKSREKQADTVKCLL